MICFESEVVNLRSQHPYSTTGIMGEQLPATAAWCTNTLVSTVYPEKESQFQIVKRPGISPLVAVGLPSSHHSWPSISSLSLRSFLNDVRTQVT
jgi:hypothetical protein